MCNFIAPTGAKSILVDDATKLYGSEYAIKAFAVANSSTFNAWYGKATRNRVGEPTLVQGKFINDKGEELIVEGRSELSEAIKTAERLEGLFNKYTNISIVADTTIDEHGFTVTMDGKTLVTFNPRTAKLETIFHEFGHIYIDLLDQTLVSNAVEELRDSDLWNKIQKLYPELNGNALGKEVLTTAIGIHAANQMDMLRKYIGSGSITKELTGKILFYINRIISEIAGLLGITRNSAERLAYDLTGGKLKNRVTGKIVEGVVRKQKNPIKAVLNLSKQIQLSADEKHYIVKATRSKLERVTNFVELLAGVFDREAAIQAVSNSDKPLYEAYETPDQVARLWADKREEGTGIHGIAELYIEGINKGVDRAKIKKIILDVPHQPDNAGQFDEDGVRIYSGMNSDQVANYVDIIFDFIDSLYAKGLKLYTEVKVYDEELGVAGTIDLLAEHPDGSVTIYDFKTKELVIKDNIEHTAFDDFNADNGKFMKGILGDVPNNANGKYSTQLSFYKAILERQGLVVNDMRIVPLVGEIEERNNQYNYKNLKLYTNSNASNFDGVTFKLQDFSQRILDAALGKDPIEEKIKRAVETIDVQDRMSTDSLYLAESREWLRNVIVDLRKSIARFTQTSDPDRAAKYKIAVEELIHRISVTDEVEAITNYSLYIVKTLYSLHKKLHGQVTVTRRESGIVEEVEFKEGYAQMTWEDIKALEEIDYDEFMEFHAFLINAEHFLSQITKIRDIPFSKLIETAELSDEDKQILNAESINFARNFEDATSNADKYNIYFKFVEKLGGKLGDAVGKLKQYEGLISDLEITIKRLNKELDRRYLELSNNPLYTGNLSAASEMFFKAQLDETFMQRYADALADTHHSYIANVIKMYDYTMHEYNEELRKLLNEFKTKTKDVDLKKLVDEKGKFILEIDSERYKDAMTEMYVRANAVGIKTAAGKKIIADWFKTNTVQLTPAEKLQVIEKKKRELSKAEYTKWFNDQHYFSTTSNTRYERRDKAFYKPNPSIYTNPAYTALSQTERDTIAYLMNLIKYVSEHTKTKFFDNGYIPAVPANQKSAMQQIKDNLGWRGTHEESDVAIVDSDGEIVNFLTFKFANLLKQEAYEKVPSNLSATAKREIYARNHEIKKRNELAHGAAIVKDLDVVMPIFLEQGLKHKYKKSIEFEIWRVRKSLSENHKIIVQKNGKPVIDKFKKIAGLSNQQVEKTAENSKIMEHYKDWIKMVFYEDFEADEGTWTKVARVLQNYTSFRGMAINPLSAVNNQVYGALMSRIESYSGEFFSRKDWFEGSLIYDKAMLSFFTDRNSINEYSSKASAFLNYFDVLMDTRELVENPNSNTATSAVAVNRLSKVLGAAYLLNNISEHNLQARLLFSMAKSHKIVNGKIISYSEYISRTQTKFDPFTVTEEEAARIVAANKERKTAAQKAWNDYTSVWNAFDFVDGKLVQKADVQIDNNQIADFERRVLGVNQYIHGIYNKSDAGAMQKFALGRLAIQFRKWMRPGWNKRWGSRAFEEYWNERRRNTDAGIYVTTLKFLLKPFYNEYDNIQQKEYAEQTTALQSLGHIIKDYGHMIRNIRVHWHSMSDGERAAIIRTMLEWASLATAVAMLYMLKYIKDDDDDPPLALMLALYQVDRTATELTTYVPMAFVPGFAGGGWMNETKKILKSPTATFSTIENLFEFSKKLIMYPFVDEETRTYKGGVYNGEDKLKVSFIKLIPIWNQINRVDNLNKNYKYYKMF